MNLILAKVPEDVLEKHRQKDQGIFIQDKRWYKKCKSVQIYVNKNCKFGVNIFFARR